MIYIMKTRKHYYKIGVSANPAARRLSLQTGSPFKIKILSTYEVGDDFRIEDEVHRMFAQRRRIGEWFYLPEKEIISSLDILLSDSQLKFRRYGKTVPISV